MSTGSLVHLGDIAQIVMGQAPPGADCNKDGRGQVFVKAGEFDERRPLVREWTTNPLKIACRGDVLVCVVGATAGKINEAIDCAIGRSVAAVRPNVARLAPTYLYHFLSTQVVRLRAKSQGLAQGVITREMLQGIVIPLLPLLEQRRIAEVLDRAEALRAKRRAALAQLDTLTHSIFLDLFGDPLANPKRWPDRTLGELLTFQQYGPRFYNESYAEDGTRIVRITDLDEAGVLEFSNMPKLAVSSADRDKYVLHSGDLIFARTGATVGKVALIQSQDPPCIAGAYFITMRFSDSVEPTYARAVLTAPSIRAIVAKRSRQAAQQNFSGPALRQLPMPLPPVELQRDFCRRIGAIDRLKTTHCVSLAELDALFASLQHRAFRGEL